MKILIENSNINNKNEIFTCSICEENGFVVKVELVVATDKWMSGEKVES